MSAPQAPGRWVRVVTVGAVLLVAAVAAIVSYAHMREVADRAGEGWRAWLLPLSVDGLVVAASMVLLTRRRGGQPGGWLPWCALLGGVGASLAANVTAAEATATARVVAAWPALAFAVAFELLLQQRRVAVTDPVGEVAEPVAESVGEDPPTPHPVVDESGEPVPLGATPDGPVGEADPLTTRTRELLTNAHAEGRPVGRRTVARELGVTEYRAGQLLARTGSNGTGGTR